MADEHEREGIPVTLDRDYNLRLQIGDLTRLQLAIRGLKAAAPAGDPIKGAEEDPLRLLGQVLVRDVVPTPDDAPDGTPPAIRLLPGDLWALQALLWAALKRERPGVTLEETAALVDDFMRSRRGTLGDLCWSVWAAWHVGFVEQEPDPNGEAEAVA